MNNDLEGKIIPIEPRDLTPFIGPYWYNKRVSNQNGITDYSRDKGNLNWAFRMSLLLTYNATTYILAPCYFVQKNSEVIVNLFN
jgi:hypothetical protein